MQDLEDLVQFGQFVFLGEFLLFFDVLELGEALLLPHVQRLGLADVILLLPVQDSPDLFLDLLYLFSHLYLGLNKLVYIEVDLLQVFKPLLQLPLYPLVQLPELAALIHQ